MPEVWEQPDYMAMPCLKWKKNPLIIKNCSYRQYKNKWRVLVLFLNKNSVAIGCTPVVYDIEGTRDKGLGNCVKTTSKVKWLRLVSYGLCGEGNRISQQELTFQWLEGEENKCRRDKDRMPKDFLLDMGIKKTAWRGMCHTSLVVMLPVTLVWILYLPPD